MMYLIENINDRESW